MLAVLAADTKCHWLVYDIRVMDHEDLKRSRDALDKRLTQHEVLDVLGFLFEFNLRRTSFRKSLWVQWWLSVH